MSNKQQIIQKAYEELGFEWKKIKSYVNEDGYLVDDEKCFGTMDIDIDSIKNEYSLTYKISGTDKILTGDEFDYKISRIRPKSIRGIENNNGWIRIENKSDIATVTKKELHKNIEYHVLMKKDNTVFYESLKINEVHSFYDKGWITHYQPIEKPNPPIY